MKRRTKSVDSIPKYVHVLIFVLSMTYSFNFYAQGKEELSSEGQEMPNEIIWNIKAYKPDTFLFDVKAIDKEGRRYDVKAIQDSDDISLLDVKAIVEGVRIPVKMIVKRGDRYYPVKAINDEGSIYDIKAITDEGTILDVKGVSKSGNVVHVRAISKFGEFYNIIAISPKGETNGVKGLKMTKQEVEGNFYGVEIFAHIKALSQN